MTANGATLQIDAHQHFWRFSPEEYAWISDEMKSLRRDFLPHDLEPLLRKAGLDGCIAVQARQTEEETRWLLELANSHEIIRGVIGWIDCCDPNLKSKLDNHAGSPWLKGFRHVLQDEKDDRFMMRSTFLNGVRQIGEAGYAYDILVYSRQIPTVIEFVTELPDMPLIIDHVAKPAIRDHEWQPWAENLAMLAAFPHIFCKVSGLVTEADWLDWRADEMERYISYVLQLFGPERILFGSDWPVCNLAATYEEVFNLTRKVILKESPEHYSKIFGLNAVHFYSLGFS